MLEGYCNLGNTFYDQGNVEAAIETYQKALDIKSDLSIAKFGKIVAQLPIIYSSSIEKELRRSNYQKRLEELANNYKLANQEELKKSVDVVGRFQPFYLTNQGLNDRYLQHVYGEMLVDIMSSKYTQWSQNIPIPDIKPNEKVRIGLVSQFFYSHSNWKIPIKGWLENLGVTYCTN